MDFIPNFSYFEGNSFSALLAADIADGKYGFLLNYPATASWAAYPNTQQYKLQDGSSQATKTSFDKICQKEPWKNLAVLGEALPGIVISPVPTVLLNYWKEHFGFSYSNIELIDCSVYLDELSTTNHFDKIITLFPFAHLKTEKHAVNPNIHYRLLSKVTLAKMGVQCPKYESYNLHQTPLKDIQFPVEFPYLIKTSHGLSGEGTYIIKNTFDLNYCQSELKKYLDIGLLDEIVVSEFIKDLVQNYCVQFYINKAGVITLLGTTTQLVSFDGTYLGGLIDYQNSDMSKFGEMIAIIGQYAKEQGYFGFIGFDVLEDKNGKLYAIDANFRVNGSTPLCLQRHTLLSLDKPVAKYSTDYRRDGTLDEAMITLKASLERKDFIILSALERVKYGKIYTEIYGIVAGKTIDELKSIEQELQSKELYNLS
ncbi:protein of unknown function DUF201 (plasmid) [Gloeothece citriformis PCC 7424]|uniref:ATP-grasp domain-containing protein n=1 Tax=Gloeothece citriformis (strain PCC 7424) TaxID=65393 RepID=B7KLS7_GLOC7|nr:hypothetical protein [Gloeothece citriformis]ACK73749.1 protein of unknown function DUF201 [Gloeothece citriformis PCC 7424]